MKPLHMITHCFHTVDFGIALFALVRGSSSVHNLNVLHKEFNSPKLGATFFTNVFL